MEHKADATLYGQIKCCPQEEERNVLPFHREFITFLVDCTKAATFGGWRQSPSSAVKIVHQLFGSQKV